MYMYMYLQMCCCMFLVYMQYAYQVLPGTVQIYNVIYVVCVSCTCTPFGQLQLVTTDVLLFMASPIIDQVIIVAGVNFLRES